MSTARETLEKQANRECTAMVLQIVSISQVVHLMELILLQKYDLDSHGRHCATTN